MPPTRSLAALAPLLVLVLLSTGCAFGTDPSKVNIDLRKEKQKLEARVAELEAKSAADARVIESLRESRPTIPTLPPDRSVSPKRILKSHRSCATRNAGRTTAWS
jgi:cell division protein FtsB